jgi:serine/threonine protein phosphatase 1
LIATAKRLFLRLGLRHGHDPTDAPRPARPIYAIGDIHGRADLLGELLERIGEDAGTHAAGDAAQIVLLGDMVDRGPDTLAVLEQARALRGAGAICLLGNHERMMLDFLDDPEEAGPRWLRHGGVETLASFGVDGGIGASRALAVALRDAMPEGLERWLRALPLSHRSGDVICVHAALDPDRPPESQPEQVMLYGHPRFARRAREDGLWVVHGHVVTATPFVDARRVACDTGAYFTDRLTAAAILPGAPIRFLTTGSA